MIDNLLNYCSKFIQLSELDKEDIVSNFKLLKLKRKALLLQEGKICDFVAFLNSGVIRHYHTKDGNDITCDITLPNAFITDFKSLIQNIPSNYNFQILKDAELFLIKKLNIKNKLCLYFSVPSESLFFTELFGIGLCFFRTLRVSVFRGTLRHWSIFWFGTYSFYVNFILSFAINVTCRRH